MNITSFLSGYEINALDLTVQIKDMSHSSSLAACVCWNGFDDSFWRQLLIRQDSVLSCLCYQSAFSIKYQLHGFAVNTEDTSKSEAAFAFSAVKSNYSKWETENRYMVRTGYQLVPWQETKGSNKRFKEREVKEAMTVFYTEVRTKVRKLSGKYEAFGG